MPILEIIWLCVSLLGLFAHLQLRYRASLRIPDAKHLAPRHPVRILAERNLRNATLWGLANSVSCLMAILSFMRDAFVLPFEAPTGLTVVAIFWLGGTAAIIGLLNGREDVQVERYIQANLNLNVEHTSEARTVVPHG